MASNPQKIRLDKQLFESGLVESREKAKALIMGGKILVNGLVADKAGTLVKQDDILTVKSKMPYVSRGGIKLEHAIQYFNVDVKNKISMDVGASTGGFTDCLLQNGARKVYAIDVGYGQFDLKLRNNARVILFEKTNIRYLKEDLIHDKIDIAVIDLSFISLLKVMPKISGLLRRHGEIVALVKPQFEVGKKDVGKGGVVKDESKRSAAVENIKNELTKSGFVVSGTTESPIKGTKGNVEYLIHCKKQFPELLNNPQV